MLATNLTADYNLDHCNLDQFSLRSLKQWVWVGKGVDHGVHCYSQDSSLLPLNHHLPFLLPQ